MVAVPSMKNYLEIFTCAALPDNESHATSFLKKLACSTTVIAAARKRTHTQKVSYFFFVNHQHLQGIPYPLHW